MVNKVKINIQNEWDKFCNNFKKLDMDDIHDVENLVNSFMKWVKYNKGNCTIEILQSFEFDTIIIIHDLFMDKKFEDSWEFLDDVIYLLDLYSNDSEENWKYVKNFWYNDTNILPNKNTDTDKIKQLKREFNEAYSYSSEALEDYIGYLSTYGGDYNYQIVQAMNKCFDDIINNKPFCDRKGLIEAINDETHT